LAELFDASDRSACEPTDQRPDVTTQQQSRADTVEKPQSVGDSVIA
jgi:hypothetical protein